MLKKEELYLRIEMVIFSFKTVFSKITLEFMDLYHM